MYIYEILILKCSEQPEWEHACMLLFQVSNSNTFKTQ